MFLGLLRSSFKAENITDYLETSEKLLLSSPHAFSGDPIIENYLKNG